MTKKLIALLTLALVAGCGAADHGDADVEFAQMMIPHHAQAVEMSDLALERADDAAVRELAAQVKAAQDPEIETMTGWLREWEEDVPGAEGHGDHADGGEHADTDDHVDGEGHDTGSMEGMQSADDIAALAAADGADFDRRWLTMMVEHHRGAIAMAEREQADGSYDPAIELAGDVVESQRAEIAQMERLLG